MAIYVMLTTLTEEGRKALKDKPQRTGYSSDYDDGRYRCGRIHRGA